MANYFSIEILAPNGLGGIKESLSGCSLSLEPWRSAYNGKVILRKSEGSNFEWSIDSSNDNYLFASGEFYNGLVKAIEFLGTLSNLLRESKFPHKIIIDDSAGFVAKEIEYEWMDRNIT